MQLWHTARNDHGNLPGICACGRKDRRNDSGFAENEHFPLRDVYLTCKSSGGSGNSRGTWCPDTAAMSACMCGSMDSDKAVRPDRGKALSDK